MDNCIFNKKYFTEDRKIKILFESGIINPHSHNFIEIVYFDKGDGWHIVNNDIFNVKSGDIFFVKRGAKHYYYSDKANDTTSGLLVYDCIFDESLFPELEYEDVDDFIISFAKKYMNEEIDKEVSYYYAKSDILFSFKSLIAKMFNEYIKKEKGYLSILKSNIIELIIMIIRRSLFKAKSETRKQNNDIIDKIINYIQDNSNKNFSIEDISLITNYSVSHLNKIFKEQMGTTILQYLNLYRMGYVGNILKTTNYSVEKIMEDVGFNDKKRFYQMFKKQYHCTPGEFRKIFLDNTSI